MARLFLVFGYFAKWKKCQIALKLFLPNTKATLKDLLKTFLIWPKWRNFAKFGHTANEAVLQI